MGYAIVHNEETSHVVDCEMVDANKIEREQYEDVDVTFCPIKECPYGNLISGTCQTLGKISLQEKGLIGEVIKPQ